jgi:ribosome-interacting GTPase 1
VLEYEGARIQLLDLPGIVQDAAKGELSFGLEVTDSIQAVDEASRSSLSRGRQTSS